MRRVALALCICAVATAAGAVGASGSGASAATATPAPKAAESIRSHYLPDAISSGVVVAYSVNVPMAGYVEVLLGSALDRQLGIGGGVAAGLPSGWPSQRVIAKAVLIAARAGRGVMRIRLSERTAARLDYLSELRLSARVIAHSSGPSPVTSMALSSATLSR